MRFIWLLIKCVLFIAVICAVLIGILFAVGSEGEGFSWSERFEYAALYGLGLGAVFGTLLALTLQIRSWRVARANRKVLARKQKP